MDWKTLFTREILKRGLAYYRQGKVQSLKEQEDGYSARVKGSRIYKVAIQASGNVVFDTDCSCPYSQEGHYCKHEAAALYLLEKKLGGITLYDEEEMLRQGETASDETPAGSTMRRREHKPEAPGQPLKGGEWIQYDILPDLKELNSLQKEMQKEHLRDKEDLRDSGIWADYRYFQPKNFRKGLNISPELLKKAKKLIRDKKMKPLRIETGYLNDWDRNDLVGVAYSGTPGVYSSDCRMVFDKQRILESNCNDWECYSAKSADTMSYLNRTLCEHEVALILMTEEYLAKNDVGDSTDREASRFLNLLQGQLPDASEPDGVINDGPVSLEPVLEIVDGSRFFASFRVGTSRLYKIKKLQEFTENVRKNQPMNFGKKTTIQLGKQYFSEQALVWWEFIENFLEDEEIREENVQYLKRTRYYTEEYQIEADIPLYGAWLDRFFENMGNRPVEAVLRDYFNFDKHKGTLTARDGKLPLELTVRPEYEEQSPAPAGARTGDRKKGDLDGVRVTGEIKPVVAGRTADYYLEEPFLYRVESGAARQLEPLLNSSQDGKIDFLIGRKRLPEFYEKILPWMRDSFSLKEENIEEIVPWLPPQPEFYTYLDANKEILICRPEVIYGGQLCPLPSLLRRPGTTVEGYRDLKKEEYYVSVITQTFKSYDPDLQMLYTDLSDDVLYHFLTGGLEPLLQTGEVYMTERFRNISIRRRVPVRMGVSLQSNLLDLSVETDELTEEELLNVLRGYREKKKYIRLKNGDFLTLDENESLEQLSVLLDSLHIPLQEFVAGKMQLPVYRALYLDKMLDQVQDVSFDRNREFKKLIRDFRTVEEADYELPDSLNKLLRQYQAEGYRWMRTLDAYGFGGILADEMGLGKTLQTIAVILACRQEESTNPDPGEETPGMPSIVVCPASLVYNWGEELARFAPELSVLMIAGSKKEREGLIADCRKADVLVTSYDLLKRDIHLYENILFRFAVVDEAQYIKNSKTAAWKAVKLLRSQTRFALTGTPIENRLSELWSIFDFLMPGLLYDYPAFRRELETPIAKNEDEAFSERLKKMVGPFILRRRKAEVLKDLPEKLEEHRYAVMEKKQRRLYDAHVKQMQMQLEEQSDEEFGKNRIQILAQLTRIRQICCDPEMYLEDYDGASAKRELCMELIHSIIEGEHKALIFSQFTSMLELLEQELEAEGIRWYTITGATPKEKRMEMVKAFNEDDTPLFLISLKAGGTGLNLTGADVVIHYDPWWNLAVQNQATDRAHRIGQTKKVMVYKLIVKNTIEERIVEMQERKRKLAEDILSAEAVSSSTLRREELLELLE